VARPKLFLIFLVLCITPLLLLAAFTYWNGVRIADRALHANQDNALTNFNAGLTSTLNKEHESLQRLTRSSSIGEFLKTRSTGTAPAANSETIATLTSNNGRVVPNDVQVDVAEVINSRSQFTALSLFDKDRRPVFIASKQSRDAGRQLNFQTTDFLSGQAQPNQQVWTTRTASVITSGVSHGASGASIYCTVPVFEEGNNVVHGALVGQLNLDSVFSQLSVTGPRPPGAESRNSSYFVVLDRSGRILYHTNEALKHQPVSGSMPHFQPVTAQMFSSDTGHAFYTTPNGQEFAVAFTRIPGLDLSVAVASDRDQGLAAARRAGLIGLIAATLFAIVAATVLTRSWQRRSRSIKRVTEGVGAIAKGELDHRFDLSSDDLRSLADNVGLVTEQLRDQIAREAESRQFDSFVRLSAILTHDLKNAIEALSLTVTNMERHFEKAEFRADAMKTLRSATENLRALVTRLSQPVTTLSGEHKRPRPVNLVPILRRVISMTAEQAVKHETKTNLPPELVAVVDPDRIVKVVENLIINALEAMDDKPGRLTIEGGSLEGKKVFFSVSDTGPGMAPRFISERLFHPFATTKKRGVGLGLYTCREVVRANGGTIDVNSREGAGTTFRVVLPSAPLESQR
jgi:signal transduction histidine kinase